MSFTHTLTESMNTSGGLRSASNGLVGGSETRINESIPAAATDQLVNFAIPDLAQLLSIFMYSLLAMTVKTNNSGAPQETISLKANVPLIWTTNSYNAVPFAGPVTALYVTNPDATTATALVIELLEDPTP